MTYLPPHFQETDAATLQYRVGKWKVSQNQPADNRQGVAIGLRQGATPSADAMAALVLGERTK